MWLISLSHMGKYSKYTTAAQSPGDYRTIHLPPDQVIRKDWIITLAKWQRQQYITTCNILQAGRIRGCKCFWTEKYHSKNAVIQVEIRQGTHSGETLWHSLTLCSGDFQRRQSETTSPSLSWVCVQMSKSLPVKGDPEWWVACSRSGM